MKNVIAVKGLSTEQYEEIKKAAKAELPFTVNIRICKRQYAYNSIDIRPKAPKGNNDPFYAWTAEEFKIVLEFVLRHGLVYTAGGFIEDVNGKDGFDKFQMQHIIHGKGFNFLRMAVYKEPEVQVTEVLTQVSNVFEERSDLEEMADDIIEYSAMLMTDSFKAEAKRPETLEEKEVFASTLGNYIQENNYDINSLVSYIKSNYSTFSLLIEALETIMNPVTDKNNTDEFSSESIEEVKEVITVINSNGSKGYGQKPDTIEELIDVLQNHSLDPTFENYGNFYSDYIPSKVTEDNKHLIGCTSFFGNFYEYSHVFNIITNDNELIDKLTAAINYNKETPAYKEARQELLIDKRMKEISDQKFHNKEIDLKSKYELSNRFTETGKLLYEQVKNELSPQLEINLNPHELEQTILKTPTIYEPVPFQIDWGTSRRGQGKRSGGMVMGAMGDAPRGVKTYYNKYGNLPDYDSIKESVRGLDHFEEFRYMKARDYGLNHEEAYVFCFGMEHLLKYWERMKTVKNKAM